MDRVEYLLLAHNHPEMGEGKTAHKYEYVTDDEAAMFLLTEHGWHEYSGYDTFPKDTIFFTKEKVEMTQ